MASFEEHCDDCLKKLGDKFAQVHIWLDEFWEKKKSFAHRDERHHLQGVEEVRKLWGDQAAEAAKIHIMKDWDCLENEIPKHDVDAALFRQVRVEQREMRRLWKRLNQKGWQSPYDDMFNH